MSRMFESNNPTLRPGYFESDFANIGNTMTIQGTVNKVGFLLILLIFAASFTWKATFASPAAGYGFIIFGSLVGFIMAMVTVFKPTAAMITAPIYTILQGISLGALSAVYTMMFDTPGDKALNGIVPMAIAMTFGTLFALLILYKLKIIKVTERFKSIVITATAGLAFGYLFFFLLQMFGVTTPLQIGGPMGLGIGLISVGLASAYLLIDFDFISKGEANGAPAHMEWYGAFSLMVTLIWLYVALLRVLAELKGGNRK